MTQLNGSEAPTLPKQLALRFALGFVVSAGILFSVYTFPYGENGISEAGFDRYLALYARAAGAVLSLLDPAVVVIDTDIIGRCSLRIVKNCDAIELNILFASAVLAFPVAWPRRLVGLILGLPALVVLNVLRICSLYYIGILVPNTFETFHMEIWPLVLVAVTTLFFLAYASWARPSATGA